MQETTNDYLVRILARDAGLLGLACTTTDLVNEAARRHAGHPVATEVLAQGLTAAALMGALLKIQQRVALKFEGDGPMRKMVVESDSYGRVRGYVARPELEGTARLHRPTPVEAIGHNGLLTVVKDLRLANLHTGIVPMSSHALAEDLAFYLNQSEQTPSLVEIDEVLAENGAEQSRAAVAGGLLVQELPGRAESALEGVAQRLDGLPKLGRLLQDGESPESVLAQLFADLEYETLEARPLRFECTCSWERSEKALIMLGRAEIETLIEEGQAVVDCHFCHERYIFGREALETIIDKVPQ